MFLSLRHGPGDVVMMVFLQTDAASENYSDAFLTSRYVEMRKTSRKTVEALMVSMFDARVWMGVRCEIRDGRVRRGRSGHFRHQLAFQTNTVH